MGHIRHILPATIGANHHQVNLNGPLHPKERDEEKRRVYRIPAKGLRLNLCGVIFTNDLVIQPIGALTILIALVDPHPIMMDCGVGLVIAQVTPPLHVSSQPFVFLLKGKEKDKVIKATMAIGSGKAKTFPPITIPTKLHQPCTTSPRPLLHKVGGTTTN